MTIRNKENYMSQLWDWGFLDNCFGGTRIRVSDIDGIVERNGRFLVIECKSHNVEITKGQKIMFENMAKTGVFHVMVIWGEPNQPERMRVFSKSGARDWNNITDKHIQVAVKQWYKLANSKDAQ